MKLTPKGYMPRLIDKEIEENLKIFGAISIEGPKWCGKTWTALNHSNSVAYLNNTVDNFREKHLAEMDVNLVLDKDKPELIDEWQEVPAIWDAVRFKCDQDKEKGKYILTGSSVPVSDKIHHSGAGRICRMKMYTMSLYESGDSSGEVSLKDLFGKIDDKNFDIRAVASTPYFLPENMSVYTAMERLRNENQRYGLVTDEFGSIEGIVTISDILGALVGSVSSGPSADIIIREDGSCLIDGQCSFYDFLDHYDMTDRYQEYNYNTLSGLILELLQHIPTEGEKIEWLCFTFEIVDMDGARIDKVLVQKNETDNITL